MDVRDGVVAEPIATPWDEGIVSSVIFWVGCWQPHRPYKAVLKMRQSVRDTETIPKVTRRERETEQYEAGWTPIV